MSGDCRGAFRLVRDLFNIDSDRLSALSADNIAPRVGNIVVKVRKGRKIGLSAFSPRFPRKFFGRWSAPEKGMQCSCYEFTRESGLRPHRRYRDFRGGVLREGPLRGNLFRKIPPIRNENI